MCNNFIGDEEILNLGNLTGLKFLDVSRNHLRSENFVKMLKNFNELQELRCKFNEFESWIMGFSMKSITTIDLEQNKLNEIVFEKPIPSLNKVVLRQNKLQYFIGVEKIMNLQELDLADNELKELPDRIDETKVSVLICNNNLISKVPFMPMLEILDASNNRLIEILKFGGKVQEVILVNNHLSHLPDLPSALSINVSSNQFRTTKAFRLCRNLQNLDLSHNPLEGYGGIVDDLVNLQLRSLALPETVLDEIKSQIISCFPSLIEVNREILPNRSLKSELNQFRSSNYWDALSKSRLFPSCRSSLTGLATPSVMPGATYTSIFSDMKAENTQNSIENFNSNYRYQLPKQEKTGRFSLDTNEEYQEKNTRKEIKSTKNSQNLHRYNIEERLKRSNTPQSSDRFSFNVKEKDERIKSQREDLVKEREKSSVIRRKSQDKDLDVTRKRVCSKANCKKHKKKGINSTVIEDRSEVKIYKDYGKTSSNRSRHQGTSPFISRDFGTNISSNIQDTYKKLDYEPMKLQKQELNESFKPKTSNLSHLFTFARTPPRPVLTHESSSPLISQISSNSYEFSLVKHLLYLEGYKLNFLTKSYTHSLHRTLELEQVRKMEKKDYNLLFYFNKEDVLKTVFTYNKGFDFIYDNFGESAMKFSLSITRVTDKLNPVNFVLLCLVDPGCLTALDDYTFTCESSQGVVPVYLIEYS